MTSVEINQIGIRTVDQGDDESGEWVLQRRGRVTASTFGDIVRRKAAYAPLVERLLLILSPRLVIINIANIFTNFTINM